MRREGRRRRRWAPWTVLMLGAALLAGAGRAQTEESLPGTPAVPMPERADRLIFVPLWIEPLGNGATRARGGRSVLADAWWPSVPLGATNVAPERAGAEGSIRLQEFRLSTAPRRAGEPRRFIAIVRVEPFPAGARPFLEVIEPRSALQSHAWGRLLRRAGDAADYIFVLPEPIPPAPPLANPALRRQIERPEVNRRFNLRLALNVPPTPQAGEGRGGR